MSEYIEREALMEELAAIQSATYMSTCLTEDECKGKRRMIARAIDAVKAAPAAAVAEVVHGEWAFTNAGWKCSLCGHSMPYWPMASTQEETNYCPNCGAKMDKEAT
jgi:ssDNA-binding Zn-finger/Zn-ribbon topoisomerase 1